MNEPELPIQPFELERYFALYEFNARILLSPSDCESLAMSQLLELADPETIRLWEALSLGYTESQGLPLLRLEISHLYRNIPAMNILEAVPEEAILIAMRTMLKPGDEVIAIYPAYQSLYEIARSTGCQVKYWQVNLKQGSWHLDMDWLEQALSPKTRLLVVNFPHNPTGYLPDLTFWTDLLDLARRTGVRVFSDEMYRGLEYQPQDQLPAAADLYDGAISLSGLSKVYALPGLRVGWLALQDQELLARFQAYKDYTTICGSAPSEILALMALRARERIIARNLDIIRKNLAAAQQFFQKYSAQFNWLPPQAGSIAFPQWIGDGSVDDFCRRALDEQGVMLVPGSIFGVSGNHFRLGLGRLNFSAGLQALSSIL